MSITKKLVVTLEDDVATPSERIFIYKGDVGVDIIIELKNFNYKIDSISEKNMINRIEAYFKNPQGIVRQYNDEVDVINGDRIKFSFSKNVINDMQIIGQYELQFHLFDKENNRITIPSYYFYVKEPLHNTSEEDNESRVDYARVDYSKVKDDIVLFEVSENGYIKTNWQSGDLITSAKLNKIESQLETNTNKINEIQPYDDTEINNSLNRLSESIKNLNIPTKTSELENDSNFTTKTYVDTKIAEASLGGEIDLSSYATKTDLNSKVDKIDGKGLSTNDYTNEEKNKLNGIEEGANNYIHPTKHEASMIIEDSTHRFVTDEEKGGWSNKSEFSGDYNDLTNKPSIPSLDGYATQTYVANAIAEAQLSGGNVDLSGYATKDDLHYHDNKEILDGITEAKITSWDNKSNFSGNYNDLTNKPNIPTKTSELENDSTFVTNTELDSKGYLTEHQDISGKVDKVEGKSLISDTEIERLAKVNNYDDTEIKRELNNKANLSDLHQHSNKEILDGITIEKITSWDNKSDFDGNYNNLTNKPSIPTKTSQLTNDSGFLTSIPSEYITETELEAKGYLTEHQDISGLATKSELDSKVDKVIGKGLSTNDLTNTLKSNYDTAYTHSQTSHITTDNVNTAVASYIDEHKAELKGDKGDIGENGKDGITPTLSIGTINTGNAGTNANITMGGTAPNYILNFTIPRGDKGDVGENGKDGSNGKDGATFTPSVDLEGNLSWTNNGGLTNPTTVNIKGNDGAKGDKGDKGDKGEIGQDGITPTLSIGTVITGNEGSNASVTIGGSLPNYTLNFTIPKGDKGDKGDIGAKGDKGDIGDKGDKGDTGANGQDGITPTLSVGTTTTGVAGSNASVSMEGSSPNYTLNFTIPKGDKGDKGDVGAKGQDGITPTLSIGTVTTGNAGSNASVTMTGNSPNYTLNFTIPKGDKGDSGSGGNVDLTNYQTKTDNSLNTTNKTIVGAINEVKTNLGNKSDTNHTHSQYITSSSIPTSLPANGGNANTVGGYTIWVGTQAEYDAISSKSSTTIYFIKG